MNWNKVKISDVGFVQGGYAFASTEYLDAGVPLIRISNIQNDGVELKSNTVFVDTEYLKIKKDFVIKKNDVLIAMSGATTGKFGIYDLAIPSLLNQRVGRIKLDFTKIDQKYFYYFMFQIQNLILGNAYGAAITNISPADIASIQIPLPPLPIQKQIASILDKADELRKKDKQLLAKYDELLQSVFYEMFGDLTKNQKKWKMKSFEDVSIKITDGTHQSPKFLNTGIPFLLVSNIVDNEITYNTNKFISEKEYLELIKRTPIEIGDILITTVGSYGNPAIVKSKKEFCFQRHIGYIKPNHKLINVEYFFGAMKSDFVKRQIEKKVRGVAQKTLNLSELKTLQLPLPSNDIQHKFATIVKNLEHQKKQIKSQIEQSEKLFQSLLKRAFEGNLQSS